MIRFPLTILIPVLALIFAFGPPAMAGAAVDCTELGQKTCMTERQCIYTGGACEQTADPCEIAWQELAHSPASCAEMTSCRYTQSQQCYCPPDVDCVCGGGAPAQCRLGE